jgi:hypothetical protein
MVFIQRRGGSPVRPSFLQKRRAWQQCKKGVASEPIGRKSPLPQPCLPDVLGEPRLKALYRWWNECTIRNQAVPGLADSVSFYAMPIRNFPLGAKSFCWELRHTGSRQLLLYILVPVVDYRWRQTHGKAAFLAKWYLGGGQSWDRLGEISWNTMLPMAPIAIFLRLRAAQ